MLYGWNFNVYMLNMWQTDSYEKTILGMDDAVILSQSLISNSLLLKTVRSLPITHFPYLCEKIIW